MRPSYADNTRVVAAAFFVQEIVVAQLDEGKFPEKTVFRIVNF
jgi:hypothetical protein